METNKLLYYYEGTCPSCEEMKVKLNAYGRCEPCQNSLDERMSKEGLDYKVRVPGGVFDVRAKSNKEAIDIAVKLHLEEITDAQKDGSLYAIPSLIKIIK